MTEVPLTTRRFDALARELFGEVLVPRGFTCEGSRHCTFSRKLDGDVFHVVMPVPLRRTVWYEVVVFPTSPRLQSDFHERFPDDLGFTLDIWSRVSEAGVGAQTKQFPCKYESSFKRGFENDVRRLLEQVAIPFLDTFQDYASILPHLRGPFAKFRES